MSTLAFVAQRIEHLTTDQKVGGSSPSKRTCRSIPLIYSLKIQIISPERRHYLKSPSGQMSDHLTDDDDIERYTWMG